MSSVSRNPALLCAFSAIQMSLFPMAVVTIFWMHDIGLSMTEIFLLQAIFAGTTALFEFPSGFVADRIGYRTSLALASAITLVGWTVYLFSPSFWTIAAAEMLLGIGLSLISGTDSAMLYESLVDTGEEARFTTWHGRSRFFGQAAEGSAALFAGVLYSISPRAPFVLEVLIWVAGFFVALRLVEPSRHRPVVTNAFRHMAGIFARIARGVPRLRAVMFLTIALAMTSFIPVWIIQIYTERAGVAISWLGPIWAAANYIVALGALASARLRERLGLMPALLLCIALAAFGYMGLGVTTAWWGFAFYFFITLMRGLNGSILNHEEQRLIPSSDRAAFISARSLAFRAAFVVIAPVVGISLDRAGEHAVLLWFGPLLIAIGLAGWLWLLRTPLATEDHAV